MTNVGMQGRVLIASTGSGRGKTTIASGLLSLLKHKGLNVHGFKCGPDYIDPMYHESVLGVPSKNLDPFFCDEDLLKASFIEDASEINVIEGCMGLYDGIGVTSECSTYSVAKALDAPIILVVDAYGAGYSIVAQIKGFFDLDSENLIRGVILNRISDAYYMKLAPVIESETGLKALGYLPKLKEDVFGSRHLGLLQPNENNASKSIDAISEILNRTLDVEAVIAVASKTRSISVKRSLRDRVSVDLTNSIIAVAKDDAFSFYYKDNIRALEYSGATIKYFSPLKDEYIPKDTTAIYLGGGYPELYLEKLASNKTMLDSIKVAADNNMPIIAECGGFMYLQSSIDGIKMVGLFADDAKKTTGLVRFGYINAQYKNYSLKGHEFHHYDVSDPGDAFLIEKVSNNNQYRAGIVRNRVLAGFPHFYFYSDPAFLEEFK